MEQLAPLADQLRRRLELEGVRGGALTSKLDGQQAEWRDGCFQSMAMIAELIERLAPEKNRAMLLDSALAGYNIGVATAINFLDDAVTGETGCCIIHANLALATRIIVLDNEARRTSAE